MAYEAEITVPANTPESAPASDVLYIARCVIRRLEITFPTGCVGLVGVRFKYQTRQLWPCNPERWFHGNGQTVTLEPNLKIDEEPFQMTIEAHNLDDTFAHTVYAVIDPDFGDDTLELLLARLTETQAGGVMPGR